ncbi:MAG: Zn-dependent hydrolase [Gammaproteobacteria bacterium]|nr:Zn-dependent hydrolase [Gammaproteobacteria bacterium]
MSSNNLQINFERLKADIEELSEIGRAADLGIYRTAFSDGDMQARKWLKEKILSANLEHYQDGAANVHGRLNWNNEQSSIMTGSHIDTVPGAGHLDGALGVVCGLEALRVIKENNLNLNFPMELVAFSDEEGSFNGMFGSQALTGDITPEWIHSAKNLDGSSLMDAMKKQGLNAMDALSAMRPANSIKAFIELHIEQGPILDSKKVPIGVVQGICGLQRWEISLKGVANHAGTTPMHMRNDALQGMAEFVSQIDRIIEEHGSEISVATVGRVELLPGAANVIPGEAIFSLEFRDTSEAILNELADAFRLTLSSLARRRKLMFEFSVASDIKPVSCDDDIQATISETAQNMGYQYFSLPSGAAHDSQKMAAITRAGMIFVPSKSGRSHSAAEWTSWDDISSGANVLLNSLYQLAK